MSTPAPLTAALLNTVRAPPAARERIVVGASTRINRRGASEDADCDDCDEDCDDDDDDDDDDEAVTTRTPRRGM